MFSHRHVIEVMELGYKMFIFVEMLFNIKRNALCGILANTSESHGEQERVGAIVQVLDSQAKDLSY